MSKAIPKEEARELFMDHLRQLALYWSKANCATARERCEGVIHSVLTTLDGCSPSIPAMDLVLRPHADDKAFHEAEGQDYFEDGQVINDDCHLHDLLFAKALT